MSANGRLIHDDAPASTIMICDGDDALLVDVSLCLSAVRPAHWLRESRAVVMAVGYLEMCEVRALAPHSSSSSWLAN